MYQAPRLVRFGHFRDLTLQQIPDCSTGVPQPWLHKNTQNLDSFFPQGINNGDGCPDVRS